MARLDLICLFLLFLGTTQAEDVVLLPGTSVHFATPAEGAAIVAVSDVFIQTMSAFDRAGRMKTDKPVSEEGFLKFVSKQVLPWNADQEKRIRQILASISRKLSAFRLPLPGVITLAMTSGNEEGHAAYCRGDAIIIPQFIIDDPDEELESLLTHELFHILSRNDSKLRDSLYALVGFTPCGDVEFPAELKSRKITNPDAPRNGHLMEVTLDGKPAQIVPILFSRTEMYDVKSDAEFLNYRQFKLLVIEKRGEKWEPQYVDGKLRLLNPAQVPGYFEKIGRNTNYIIHPEEVLADNFVLLVNGQKDVPTPRLLDEMRTLLQKGD